MKSLKSYTTKKSEVEQDWHLINGEGQILGRVASDIAQLLIGKHKANYSNHINVGDKVVVVNAEKLEVTGNKMTDKVYKRYTGYPGGIKEESLKRLMSKRPEEVLRRAVKGMLPKNKIQKKRLSNLYIYPGTDHPHKGQIKS